MSLFLQSPNNYFAKYVGGKPEYTSKEMQFGSRTADLLEHGSLSGDTATDLTLCQIPAYEIKDKPFFAKLEEIDLLAKFDSVKPDFSAFYEYKTGKTPWTQVKADASDQITFYATVCFLLTGKIPEMELIWIRTQGKSEISFSGDVVKFPTTRSMIELLRFQRCIKDCWRDIGNFIDEKLS